MSDDDREDDGAEEGAGGAPAEDTGLDKDGYHIVTSNRGKFVGAPNPLREKMEEERRKKEARAAEQAKKAKLAAMTAAFQTAKKPGKEDEAAAKAAAEEEARRVAAGKVPEATKGPLDSKVKEMMASGIAGSKAKGTALVSSRGRGRGKVIGGRGGGAAGGAGGRDDGDGGGHPRPHPRRRLPPLQLPRMMTIPLTVRRSVAGERKPSPRRRPRRPRRGPHPHHRAQRRQHCQQPAQHLLPLHQSAAVACLAPSPGACRRPWVRPSVLRRPSPVLRPVTAPPAGVGMDLPSQARPLWRGSGEPRCWW